MWSFKGGKKMKQLLLTLRDELNDKLKRTIWKRSVSLPDVSDKINVITGMRRTGKSYYMLGIIKELLSNGVESQRIAYINFEDDRLLPVSQKSFGELIDTFYEINPDNHDNLCYLFFDEVQNVEGWAEVIRRIFDTKKVRIFITGSSAKMLSREISTSLRGRSLNTEMWPLEFSEFPSRVSYPVDMSRKEMDQFSYDFDNYINTGGFPEVISYDPETRVRVLQDYVEIVVFRDIVERHNVSNIQLIKYVIKTVLYSAGKMLSVNKLYNDIKSQGIKVGKSTLYEYLEYIEDCYLCFSVPVYSDSLRVVQSNPKKMYAVDTGLIKAFTLKVEDYGSLFENVVYIALRRRGYKIYYYLTIERYEVDFLVKDISGKMKLYQVCYNIKDKDTLAREERALNAAMKELNVDGEIVTPVNFLKVINQL